jgi:hypothetical protein
MQPAQAKAPGSNGGNRALKRWGPIAGVVAVAAIVVGVVVATSGGDDDEAADTTVAATAAPADTTAATEAPSTEPAGTDATGSTDGSAPAATDAPAGTTAPAEVTFPLSFAQAEEQGLTDQVDWGDRCDTSTGQLAVPDFFAQPCMAPFTGDNGGATDTGVTADEITIVYYEGQEGDPIIQYITDAVAVDDTNPQQFDTMNHLIDYYETYFYETYFELYGRKVNLITYEGTGGSTDDVAARADAARIAEEYQPFVVLGGPALASGFADELAAREIMCIGCTPGQPDQFYVDRDPYVWALDGSQAQKQAHAVEMITKQLIGKNATHAGDEFVDQPRTFGLLYLESSAASKDLADQYVAAMDAAGAPFAEVVSYALDPATIQNTASQAISKLKAAGVTTIVFSGDPVAPRDFTKEATAQEYFPEWFISASGLVDTNAFARTYDQQQWAHAFGVTQGAVRTDPTAFGYYAIYQWFNGEPPPADGTLGVIQPNPALFFAVAQAVGPNLTHETWKEALFAGTGTKKAISQPFLSWGEGLWPSADYNGVDDATEFWWDPTATGPDEIRKDGTGMYQFVDGGTRYLPGEWPSEDKLFDPDGAVAIYTTPPPGEEPPSYPSPAGS